MNVGSLFSGIGGFDLGFGRAGMRTAWFCEQDDYCTRVLNRHWPGVPVYPDISTLRGSDVEPVDVLCGGFPCQDLSVAGKGAGIDGTRSGLWSEFARLIGELRPRYVVVENVTALLGRGAGRVLRDLAALGYDAEWDCLPASAFGAPHRRDRIWIVAYPGSEELEGQRRPERNGAEVSYAFGAGAGGGHTSLITETVADPNGERELQPQGCEQDLGRRSGSRSKDLAYTQDLGYKRARETRQGWLGSTDGSGRVGWWEVEPNVGRVVDGLPDSLDRNSRLKALGNALVPQIAEWIGNRIMEAK